MKFKAWHKKEKKWITNFILTPSGRVWACSEFGEDIDFEEFQKNNRYNDSLDSYEITDEVEITIESKE